ncbi:MAG: two-component system response regulator [Desulfobacterales bacterium]|nr:MAG: two-component system response regulator [Desulfobacterales bacterium]
MDERFPEQIMVVEDEVLIGLMLTSKLKSHGYRVGDIVTTGEEAVERAGLEKPSVILMDVTLAGELSGIDAARQIHEAYGIPCIIFTGYDDKSLDEQARQVGPVGVLAKMGPIADIVAAIEQALKYNRKERGGGETEEMK